MSLVVWLPLTKDLRQQGLNTATVSGGTINDNGKLGKCFLVNNSTPISITYSLDQTTEWSYSMWLKLPASMENATAWEVMIKIPAINNTSGNAAEMNISWASYHNIKIYDNGSHQWVWLAPNSNFSYDKWFRLTVTHTANGNNGVTGKVYIDSTCIGTFDNTTAPLKLRSGTIRMGNWTTTGGFYINDFRLYDHCLSPMEVKELAKGLVLHYPLSDNSIQSLDNCYAYPRFETSNSNGGWSHWGSSGHVGTYGQTTDTNYIFRNGQTYAHWVADGSSATKDYLLYQEPAFDGGLRSLVAICKEENSRPITNNICYATWNARNGGVVNNSWTSIESLGDGFYLCKCEGISQDGSNDLVGIFIKPGYKVYFSEVYLENGRNISSDIFFPSTILYDCSGYCYNSILNASTTVTSDTPKYNVSSFFGAYNTPNAIVIDAATLCPALSNCTIAWWQKSNGAATLLFTGQTTSYYVAASNANNYYHGSAGSPTMYRDGVAGTYQNTTGIWHHYVLTGVNLSSWTALKLNSYSGGWPVNGYISDLRIYATALSADDVKSLYQNSAYIDSSGNIYGAVHTEV